MIDIKDRFAGSLLGLAVGDALGALFEGQSAEHIWQRFAGADELVNVPIEPLTYTDDTQMAIGIAETLIEYGEIIEQPSFGVPSHRAVVNISTLIIDYTSANNHFSHCVPIQPPKHISP